VHCIGDQFADLNLAAIAPARTFVQLLAPSNYERPTPPQYLCEGLVGVHVVVAALGCGVPTQVLADLDRSEASVTLVTDVPALRRVCALVGPAAGVLLYLGEARDAVPLAPVLRRQAVVVAVCPTADVAGRMELMAIGAGCAFQALCPDEALHLLSTLLRPATAAQVERSGPEVLAAGRLTADRRMRAATVDGRPVRLTALEFDLLSYLLQHPGDALTRERLLSDVWGFDIGGLDTVTVHVRRLRSKIEADPAKPVLLETVWGVGYRLVPDAADGSYRGVAPSLVGSS